jgi:hypothetical protein
MTIQQRVKLICVDALIKAYQQVTVTAERNRMSKSDACRLLVSIDYCMMDQPANPMKGVV